MAERPAGRRASSQPQAQFLWACLRDLFHYCAVHLAEIAHSARDVDQALRWGFGWSQGPFELWQAAGWQTQAAAVAADIAAGKSSSPTPLPAWALDPARQGVHGAAGAWAPQLGRDLPRSPLPVYARQVFPARLLGEPASDPATSGETLFATPAVRLWRLPARDARIGIVSLQTKAHALNRASLAGLRAAIDYAEAELDGLVLWQPAPFAVGADLAEFVSLGADADPALLEAAVADFQQTGKRIKFAQVPVVAAVSGMALGGGCEFAMLARRRVLALESQLGLVEAGVGLIPAGGGCKEMALLAAERAAQSFNPEDLLVAIQPLFQRISRGRPGNNGHEARVHGYARADDPVLFTSGEVLQVALGEARALADAGHVPPLPRTRVPVAGRTAIATLEMQLVNQLEGGMISAHDYRVARATAVALCGGDIEGGSLVDEDWLLAVERQQFVALLQTPETQARIRHMLDTGKPLRN
jgi:3-hydroxyacyl-CoA dehydrogenase